MLDSHFIAADPEALGIDRSKLEALLTRAGREVNDGLLPAAQIAVARHGKIVAMRTFGSVTHAGTPAAAGDDTLFCVFSATKAITSAAAWLLMQEGKLAIEERVCDIVPEFGTHGKDVIKVEQLLTHTAGFPHAPFDPARFLDRGYRLQRFAEFRLNWEPSTRFEYHPSSGMYVVAEIIERRSGMQFGEFVRERISKPLGLPDLWVGLPRALHARLADIQNVGNPLTDADYARLGRQRPPTTEVTEDALLRFNRADVREAGIPGGGGTMTAAELALFYQALLNDGRAHDGAQIWKPETLHMARTVRTGGLRDLLFGALANRGLGLIISGDEQRAFRGFGHTNSELAFGHGGAGGQVAWGDPVTGISVGYCTNGHDRDPLRQARRSIGISSRAADLLEGGAAGRSRAPLEARGM
jgi:CubicO group peptidase (beta-lactamase class C family)